MSDLAAYIRERLASSSNAAAGTPVNAALHDVLDKCEQMRAESARHPGGVGHFFADEFEQSIARALDLTD